MNIGSCDGPRSGRAGAAISFFDQQITVSIHAAGVLRGERYQHNITVRTIIQ
jgi:hypothetical protein